MVKKGHSLSTWKVFRFPVFGTPLAFRAGHWRHIYGSRKLLLIEFSYLLVLYPYCTTLLLVLLNYLVTRKSETSPQHYNSIVRRLRFLHLACLSSVEASCELSCIKIYDSYWPDLCGSYFSGSHNGQIYS